MAGSGSGFDDPGSSRDPGGAPIVEKGADPTQPIERHDPAPPSVVGKHRKAESWGPREILALIVILGSFALAFAAIFTDYEEAQIPAWVAALIGGIAFYYYKNGKEG